MVSVVKKGSFLGQTSPPNYPVGCTYATTSISLNLNLAFYFVHGERKSYKGVQVIPVLLEIHYRQPNISNIASLLPLSKKVFLVWFCLPPNNRKFELKSQTIGSKLLYTVHISLNPRKRMLKVPEIVRVPILQG